MLVTLCLFPLSAFAAKTVSASIPVEIEGGGTAIVIAEVNCPLPERSSIEVADDASENINITFSQPGDYIYTIRAESDDVNQYSPVYYTASIAVRTDGGELTVTVILTKADSDYKPDSCSFVHGKASTEEPTEPAPTQPDAPKNPPTSRPKTGDDSMLDIYLLICIAASGGLFLLSVVYLVSTNRMLDRK